MGLAEECQLLTKSFSGLGVDEKSIVDIAQKWNSEHKSSFRKESPHFSKHQHHSFEHWHGHWVNAIHREFLRFKEAVVLWTMHPWERDARLVREALINKTYHVIIEIACTRSAEELLGARRAYHSLFHHSIEEDVAFDQHISIHFRNLLVPLVSAYRYEGSYVNEEAAKSEAKILGKIIRTDKKAIDSEEIVRIVGTRSKTHLKVVFKHYKEIHGKTIDEDLQNEPSLRDTILCLISPETYFSKVLEAGLVDGADEVAKEGLIRVIVTRAHDHDMKEIKAEYQKKYGVPLPQKIKEKTHGSFKEFLVTLVEKAN
ncbi:hypothetical protein Sjap_012832 [Stephania japonica]|uniref:Annexin n=1 Tax=Stephania japonica TaxID=461633 RepID=A0AAP0IXL7_9MAGN